MLSLDLFDSKYERELREGAVDDLEYRRMNDLREKMDYLMQAAKQAKTSEEKEAIMKRYNEYKAEREGYLKIREQQVPSKQDPFAYVKPEPKGIGDIQDPQQKMAQLSQRSKKGPLANVGAGIKAFIKGEPEPLGEQELGRRGIGITNIRNLELTASKGLARTIFQFPSMRYVVDEDDSDKMVDYYNALDSAGRTNFVYNVLGDGMKFLEMCRSLGIKPTPMAQQQPELPGIQVNPQGQLPLSEKKKSNNDDLEAGDVKVARELQKLRAQYPAARSDVEAVARAEIDSTERSQQQLAAIRGANEKQDALLKQLVDLDQEQGREISGLDKENDSLEQRLAQVQATNDRLQQTIGTMTGTKKAATKATATNASQTGSMDLAQGGIIDVGGPAAGKDANTSVDQTTTDQTVPGNLSRVPGPDRINKAADIFEPIQKKAAESKIKEHGGGIGPKQHWQDLMQEGQPQELINRYLAIDAENDVDAVRAAIQAISKDPALSVTSKSRLLGQIGMIIRRHRLPIGRAYYQFMRQYMEDISETALNPKDPKDDYEAKRRALHDLSLNKDVDQAAVLQRRLDLDREAKAKGLAETVTNVKAGMAEIYRRLAPKIERHRDSFLAGQLYDELENYAELHGAEGEFKRMMSAARNRAHMEYDTNPGGFQNWFWFLPFEDEQLEEGLGDTLKSLWREIKTYVVDFVANAVGLPDDQRREVFVQAGNTFSNEVTKLLANHPARDKLIPMVREIGGYMAKARTLKELNSLMDKADLFLADVDAGKFDPPVAKTLPSFGDRQGMSENTDELKKKMSKLEALALAANRAGDDAKCKMYQQKIQSLKQKLSQSMAEGWSDQGNPTPYSVYIDGREWKAFASDDHARAVAEKVQANLQRQGRDQTVTIAPSKAKKVQESDEKLLEGIKDTASATAVIACLLTGGSLTGCATAPQQTSAQQVLKTGQDMGRIAMNAKKITRAGTEEEARQELRNILRGVSGRPEELNHSNILRIWRRVNKSEPQPQNEAKEPTNQKEYFAIIDRLDKEIAMEQNRAVKQMLMSRRMVLQQHAQDAGWIPKKELREDTAALAAEDAILKRIFVKHKNLMMEYGPDKITQAAESVAYNVGDIAHITDDQIQEWVDQVEYILGARP